MDLFEQIRKHLGDDAVVFWDRDGVVVPDAHPFAGSIVDFSTKLTTAFAGPYCYVTVVAHNGRYIAGWTGVGWLARHLPQPESTNAGSGNEDSEEFVQRIARAWLAVKSANPSVMYRQMDRR